MCLQQLEFLSRTRYTKHETTDSYYANPIEYIIISER